MKRILLILLLSLFVISSGYASYGLFSDALTFSWYAGDSLYPEATVNPFSSTSVLNILYLTDGQPRSIKYANTGSGEYDDVPIYDSPTKYADEKMYLQLKTGLNIGFFRLSLQKYVQAELAFQGALNTVFQGFGGADNMGFDGVFFFGFNTRFFDMVSVRVGLQHYSGHYGDETLAKLTGQSGFPIEYTRDNNLLVGLAVQPVSFARLYAEASVPMTNTWMHPAIHIPSFLIKRTNNESLHDQEAGSEGIAPTLFGDTYKAWILNAGSELRLPIRNVGSLLLAFDVMAHQDGQTKHSPGGYDEENPWELEYTVGLGLEFFDELTKGCARIMITYHDGRFPLLNYFYHRTKYFAVGFMVSM